MTLSTETTWPLKEALERCFPESGRRIALSTIHQWLQRRVIRPVKHSKKRGPGGNRVSVADLVTISILSELFEVGVKFKAFSVGLSIKRAGGKFVMVSLSDQEGKRKVSFDCETLSEEDTELVRREVETLHRPIQAYLESTGFQCFVRLVVEFEEEVSHRIYFEQTEPWKTMRPRDEHDPDYHYTTAMTAFIYVSAHLQYVLHRMS